MDLDCVTGSWSTALRTAALNSAGTASSVGLGRWPGIEKVTRKVPPRLLMSWSTRSAGSTSYAEVSELFLCCRVSAATVPSSGLEGQVPLHDREGEPGVPHELADAALGREALVGVLAGARVGRELLDDRVERHGVALRTLEQGLDESPRLHLAAVLGDDAELLRRLLRLLTVALGRALALALLLALTAGAARRRLLGVLLVERLGVLEEGASLADTTRRARDLDPP